MYSGISFFLQCVDIFLALRYCIERQECASAPRHSPVAQSAEQVAVNHWVWCSNHHGGAMVERPLGNPVRKDRVFAF